MKSMLWSVSPMSGHHVAIDECFEQKARQKPGALYTNNKLKPKQYLKKKLFEKFLKQNRKMIHSSALSQYKISPVHYNK